MNVRFHQLFLLLPRAVWAERGRLFECDLWSIHPHCSHQYHCPVSSALSAIVGLSTCPHVALCFFSFLFFFFTGRKLQPVVRRGAGRRDRGGKLMKLFDGSPGHGARGEVEWTSVWQWDGWGARERQGKEVGAEEGERTQSKRTVVEVASVAGVRRVW